MSMESRKAQVIRYWWGKSEDSLRAARRELTAGDHGLAVSPSASPLTPYVVWSRLCVSVPHPENSILRIPP